MRFVKPKQKSLFETGTQASFRLLYNSADALFEKCIHYTFTINAGIISIGTDQTLWGAQYARFKIQEGIRRT